MQCVDGVKKYISEYGVTHIPRPGIVSLPHRQSAGREMPARGIIGFQINEFCVVSQAHFKVNGIKHCRPRTWYLSEADE